MMVPFGGRLVHDFAVRVPCCIALSSNAVCVRGGCGARGRVVVVAEAMWLLLVLRVLTKGKERSDGFAGNRRGGGGSGGG